MSEYRMQPPIRFMFGVLKLMERVTRRLSPRISEALGEARVDARAKLEQAHREGNL